MPDPQLRFDREELTLTISGLTGGWSLGQLGELHLLDQAQLQFPSSWSDFQAGVAMQVVESQWRLSSRLVLTQTLEAGVEFSSADGVGSSMSLDNELKLHLLDRPTTRIDLLLNVKLDGEFDGQTFNGSGQVGVGLRATFEVGRQPTAASISARTSGVISGDHIEGLEVLDHLAGAAGAGDDRGHVRVVRAPRDGQLGHRAAELVGDGAQVLDLGDRCSASVSRSASHS